MPWSRNKTAQAAPVQAPFFVCPATIITQWTFTGEVATPSTGTGIFANGSGLSPSVPPYTYFGGPADPAISFSGWNASFDANDYLQFSVDTTGKMDIGISLDYQSTGSGPTTIDLYYSVDGTNFSSFGMSKILIRDSNFHPLSFNLSSITALNNNANTSFRVYAYGASGGNLRVDDVTITETCQQSPMISEVAWFGTQAFPGDEWIEIYNPASGVDIDLTNWRVEAADGDPAISLSGTLTAGSFLLLERGSQSVISDVAGYVYTSAQMSDSGEILYLLDDTSSVVDSANSNGAAWPAGMGSPNYFSMERLIIGGNPAVDGDFGWVSNNGTYRTGLDALGQPINGTPGGANWASTVTPTFTPTITSTPTATSTSPPSPPMTLLINEVAWMGTLASSSDEWIELYNPGASAINLANWKLNATDGSPAINLTGAIPAGGYFLLGSSSAVFNDLTVNQTFSGSMSNEGEVLRLLDPSNTIVDTANSDSGAWPAGVASPTYATMERRGAVADGFFSWSTFAGTAVTAHDRNNNPIKGTPGGSNWGLTVTLTPTATPTATRTPTRVSTSTSSALVGRPVINEFLARPGFDWNQDGNVDVFDEFIELKNLGPVNIDLGGWKLDDEANLGSNPYSLTGIVLRPGERIVFYGLETNILLSDGGDTVRLLNPGGKIYDSYTYPIARAEDESICRLPDGNGSWFKDCVPTPNLTNTREGEAPSMPQGNDFESPVCELPDTLPVDFLFAECRGYGANIWRAMFWDADGWQGDVFVQENFSKWHSFIE